MMLMKKLLVQKGQLKLSNQISLSAARRREYCVKGGRVLSSLSGINNLAPDLVLSLLLLLLLLLLCDQSNIQEYSYILAPWAWETCGSFEPCAYYLWGWPGARLGIGLTQFYQSNHPRFASCSQVTIFISSCRTFQSSLWAINATTWTNCLVMLPWMLPPQLLASSHLLTTNRRLYFPKAWTGFPANMRNLRTRASMRDVLGYQPPQRAKSFLRSN